MPYIPSGSELLNPVQILERAGIRAGMQVADLGCGTIGHMVIPAARMVGERGKVFGVDILKNALSGVEGRARLEGITNIETVWGDFSVPGGVRIKGGSLDLVMFVNNEPSEAMLKEGARLIKPGGTLLIVDWKPTASPIGPPTKDRVAAEVMKARATATGFKCIDEFEAGKYHYGLTFNK